MTPGKLLQTLSDGWAFDSIYLNRAFSLAEAVTGAVCREVCLTINSKKFLLLKAKKFDLLAQKVKNSYNM